MIRLQFDKVSKFFPPVRGRRDNEGVQAIQDVDVSVKDGEVVALIGPSGCGKSTLLNLGSGLDRPTGGRVFVDGEQVDGPNEHVAFMLQKDLLLPWRTIRKNVEFGQEIRGLSSAERARSGDAFPVALSSRRICRSLSPRTIRRHAPAGCACPDHDDEPGRVAAG